MVGRKVHWLVGWLLVNPNTKKMPQKHSISQPQVFYLDVMNWNLISHNITHPSFTHLTTHLTRTKKHVKLPNAGIGHAPCDQHPGIPIPVGPLSAPARRPLLFPPNPWVIVPDRRGITMHFSRFPLNRDVVFCASLFEFGWKIVGWVKYTPHFDIRIFGSLSFSWRRAVWLECAVLCRGFWCRIAEWWRVIARSSDDDDDDDASHITFVAPFEIASIRSLEGPDIESRDICELLPSSFVPSFPTNSLLTLSTSSSGFLFQN